MLLGVAVIAVPLLVAIFNAALQIQQLADSSRTVASEGIGSARASEDLMSEVLLLERATCCTRCWRTRSCWTCIGSTMPS